MYKNTDNYEILQAPLRILRWHHLWPKEGQPLNSINATIHAIIGTLSFSLAFFGMSSHLIYILRNQEHLIVLDLIEDLIVLLVHMTVYYTIYSLVSHKEQLGEFLHDLSDYSRFGKPPNIEKANKIANYFSYFFYIYCATGTIVYSSHGILEKSACEKFDVNHTRVCGHPMPIRVPYPVKNFSVFALTWISQTISLTFFLNSGSIIMGFIYGSVEVYISKIQHLRECLLKLGERPEHAREGIRFCVEYHVKIISISKKLNGCWGKLMLYHQLLVSGILATIGIQFLMKPDLFPVIHAIGWLISLSIPCYAGQRLVDESMLIPFDTYSCNWYDLDPSTRKDLVFIIQNGNNYLNLNRNGYGPMDLSIVVEVANNIYSLLTLLSRSMEEKN